MSFLKSQYVCNYKRFQKFLKRFVDFNIFVTSTKYFYAEKLKIHSWVQVSSLKCKWDFKNKINVRKLEIKNIPSRKCLKFILLTSNLFRNKILHISSLSKSRRNKKKVLYIFTYPHEIFLGNKTRD